MMRWMGLLLVFAAAPALAWGTEGHALVARIAAHELTPHARAGVEALLGAPADESMAAVSSWPDRQGRAHPETRPWHYVDIEIGSAGYDAARDCPAGACVVAQIARAEAVLEDHPAQNTAARRTALVWLIHLVGDIHQPLHCADRHDRGGNAVVVVLDSRETNLHRVWDTEAVRAMGDEEAAYRQMMGEIGHTRMRDGGAPEDWANESFAIARGIYAGLRPNGDGIVSLDDAEIAKNDAPVARRRIEKAGVRLAALLNAALK